MIVFLAACSEPERITGVNWRLISYGSATEQIQALPDVETSLTFDKDGLVSGTMGCNRFSGEYKLRGDKITFGPISSTLMACEEALMQQETAVFNLLSGELKVDATADALTLTSEDGVSMLVFSK